jgi:hypothetical protein
MVGFHVPQDVEEVNSIRVWKLLFEPIDALELFEVGHAPGFVVI